MLAVYAIISCGYLGETEGSLVCYIVKKEVDGFAQLASWPTSMNRTPKKCFWKPIIENEKYEHVAVVMFPFHEPS